MTANGALLSDLIATFGMVDPAYALIAGIVLGACGTLLVLRWSPARREKADPLSGLFAGDTLGDQLSRVTDPEARLERKDREASAIRAKIFAHQSKAGSTATQAKTKSGPHHAERFDHAAVLDHIAKVMRAGTENGDPSLHPSDFSDEWQEVPLLPAPPQVDQSSTKAA